MWSQKNREKKHNKRRRLRTAHMSKQPHKACVFIHFKCNTWTVISIVLSLIQLSIAFYELNSSIRSHSWNMRQSRRKLLEQKKEHTAQRFNPLIENSHDMCFFFQSFSASSSLIDTNRLKQWDAGQIILRCHCLYVSHESSCSKSTREIYSWAPIMCRKQRSNAEEHRIIHN